MKGLYLINQRHQAFNSWSFSAQNYIIGGSVSSIAQGENRGGKHHILQYNCGVFCFDASGEVSSPILSHLPALVLSIKTDVAISGSAMAASRSTATTLIQVHTSKKWPFPSTGIYCMTDDAPGNLYISVYSKGLYI